jgi:hypothetical protein
MINKHEKSGVIILSGDVHWAQLFSTGCSSYPGGYLLPEVCSSGMTHVLSDTSYNAIETLMEAHTPLLFKMSEIEMVHNYATVDIKRSAVDQERIEISVNVNTYGNHVLLTRKFSVGGNTHDESFHSLNFNTTKQRYSAMCR